MCCKRCKREDCFDNGGLHGSMSGTILGEMLAVPEDAEACMAYR